MTHRGGNGFDSGESPSRDAAVRGFDSRPLHTRSLFNCESSCEAVAEAIPPRLRGHDGAIIMEVWNDYRSDYHRNRFRNAVLPGNSHRTGVAMNREHLTARCHRLERQAARRDVTLRLLVYIALSAASAAIWSGIAALALRLSGADVMAFCGAMFCATLFSVMVVCNGNVDKEAF